MIRPILATLALASLFPFSSHAQVAAPPPLAIKALAERTVADLPPGTLVWRVEHLSTLAEAKQAAGPHALAVEAAGKAWLFTLGASGGATPGATPVAEVGPIPRITAPNYLLRINQATGAPGSITPIHTHPGSEAFLVLSGEQTIRSPHGTMRVAAGRSEAGHGSDVPMQVSSTGNADLLALVMFVVDATRPFSSPAAMP